MHVNQFKRDKFQVRLDRETHPSYFTTHLTNHPEELANIINSIPTRLRQNDQKYDEAVHGKEMKVYILLDENVGFCCKGYGYFEETRKLCTVLKMIDHVAENGRRSQYITVYTSYPVPRNFRCRLNTLTPSNKQ